VHVRPAATRLLPLVVAVIGFAWLTLRTHQVGHDWGDDFALYIRQAQGLIEGRPGEIVSDNRFALANSSWSTFSPESYPWGWPLLLAPVVWTSGVDYAALKLLGVALWCSALVFWHLVVRDRAGAPTAWVAMLALGFSWPVVVWTNSVVSDIPYLACAFGTLWWMDRCRRNDAWAAGSVAPLVVLGLLLSFTFNVRREGLALVAATAVVAALQSIAAWRGAATPTAGGGGGTGRRLPLPRAAIPLVTFVVASAVFQLAVPSVVAPRYPGSGLSNIPARLAWYRDVAAQQLGLFGPYDDDPTVWGSTTLALVVLAGIVALAVVGMVLRSIQHPRTDLPLAVFALAHAFVIGIAPFQEGRYLFPVIPVIVYFAVMAPRAVLAAASRGAQPSTLRRRVATAPVLALIATLGLAGLTDTWRWGTTATELRQAGVVQDGPTDPYALEMFVAVEGITETSDVVAFFRARAMTMVTGRRSIQSSDIETIIRNADWYAMERGSTYSQPLISPDEAIMRGLDRVWTNNGWILYRVTDSARDRGTPQSTGG
jgi:hypothetical protein